MNFDISKETIQSGMETMNSFGLRLTGSEGQQKFADYLKDEIHKMGFKTYSAFIHLTVGKKSIHLLKS